MAAHMNAIPDEILYNICSYLETIDKLRLACTNQRLRKILSSPLLNKKAKFSHCWHIPYKTLQQYIEKNNERIQHLELQDCYWLKQDQIVRSVKKCTNLVSLDVSGCTVSDKNIMEIMGKCSKLKHLGWTVDKKTHINAKDHSHDKREQVKQLNYSFKNLSSIKLVLYQEKGDFLKFDLLMQMRVCRYLLSDLCLTHLELILLTNGQYVSHPVHVAMETIPGKEASRGNQTYPSVLLNICFPPSNCRTVILPFSTTHRLLLHDYWDDQTPLGVGMETLFGDNLQLRNLDISGTRIRRPSIENMGKLLSCPSLEFINIGAGQCSVEELLSISSPVLESINLKNSIYSLNSDFLILENLSEKCPRLKHINLLSTHRSWYCTSDGSKDFIKVLSSFKSLVSLAVNPCCIRGNASAGNTSHQNCDEAVNSLPLAALVKSCTQMTEFELIDSKIMSDIIKHDNFSNSSFYRHERTSTGTSPSDGDGTITLSLDTLTCISQWKYLQKLTLAGFQVNRADFFIAICKECTELQSLSIAHLKGPALSHSGNVSCLTKALTYCHNLKDFRLEQPHFDITKHFLNALHHVKKLERICLMVNHGKLAVEEIEPWLNKCSEVIFVQMFCDVTLEVCKVLKRNLETKFVPHRPAFKASFFAFHYVSTSTSPVMGDQSPRKCTPLVHLQDMTMFRSQVASRYRFCDEF